MEINFSEIGKLKPFAHHPDCEFYANHLIKVFSFTLCLGCFFMSFGIFVSVIISYIISGIITFNYVFYLIPMLLLIPTFIQPHYQNKLFKIFSRMCLGLGIGIYFYPLLFLVSNDVSHLFIKLLFVLLFVITTKLTLNYRNNNTPSPCGECKFGAKPICKNYLHDYEKLLEDAARKREDDSIELLNGIIKSIKENTVGIVN
jgi:hypothetical protein